MSASRFTRRSSPFSMTCAIEVAIRATPEVVWILLTDATRFPHWNSTVTRIEGRIREGSRIRIHVPGTRRTFTPTVSEVVTAQRMTWSDGIGPVFRGVRTFTLDPRAGGSTHFTMTERFSGLAFALTRPLLPDFRPIFEAYGNDLKREAERIAMELQDSMAPRSKTA